MRPILALPLAAMLLAGVLPAQNPRPVTLINPGAAGTSYSPAVVSEGDLSAVIWNDNVDKGVYVSVGDGHGLGWSAPVRIDSDVLLAEKRTSTFSLAIQGDSIYAVWRDARLNTLTTVYYDTWVNVSHDGGATWQGDQVLDKFYTLGSSHTVLDFGFAVSGSDIYVAQLVDNGNDELWIAASHDGGATWNPAVNASTSLADIDDFAITTDGANVNVAWSDDRAAVGADDLWFRMSHDSLATWMAPEVQLDASGPLSGDIELPYIFMTFQGSNVALCWIEDNLPTSVVDEELHFLHSGDGGHTWDAEVTLQSGFDTDNHWMSGDGSTLIVAWEDNRSGADQVYAAVSPDQGATWTENLISAAGGGYPRALAGGDYAGVVFSAGALAPETCGLAVSRDAGTTFLPALDLASGTMVADTDFSEVAYNAKYRNFVAAWLADDLGVNHVYAGGLRCQTLSPIGTFSAGLPISFEVDNVGASEAGGFFGTLVAAGPGHYTLPFPGAYDIGLASDPYLTKTLSMNPGPLTGGVDAAGHGSTSTLPLPAAVPPGTVLHCVAIAFKTAGGVAIGSITDVTTVTVL